MKPTILVVDDEQAIVNLCVAILDRAGFSILPATNSSESLKIAKHHAGPIHLLLTDLVIHSPKLPLAADDNEFHYVQGHELAVRALRLRKDLRVILMPGYFDQDLEATAYAMGSSPLFQNRLKPTLWWHSCRRRY